MTRLYNSGLELKLPRLHTCACSTPLVSTALADSQVGPTRITCIPQGSAAQQLAELLEFHERSVAAFRQGPKKTGSKRAPACSLNAAQCSAAAVVLRVNGLCCGQQYEVASSLTSQHSLSFCINLPHSR